MHDWYYQACLKYFEIDQPKLAILAAVLVDLFGVSPEEARLFVLEELDFYPRNTEGKKLVDSITRYTLDWERYLENG